MTYAQAQLFIGHQYAYQFGDAFLLAWNEFREERLDADLQTYGWVMSSFMNWGG